MSFADNKQYVQFTALMHREYEHAVKKMREELSRGQTYDHAYDTLVDISQEIKSFVREDFLKTIIAEEHFGAGMELSDIALFLELPYEKVESAKVSLINDMMRETEYHLERRTKQIS